jgi:hypothetical protein
MPRKPARKPQKKRSDSDPEQYKRFREMGDEIGASKDPKDFEKAFKKVTTRRPS